MNRKFGISQLYILIFCLMFVCCNAVAQQDVSASTFQEHINLSGAQIIDARTPDEYNNGHIKDALLLDWLNQDQFKERVQYIDKSRPVLVYCASGGRSSEAAKWLSQNGFHDVENLKGGITQWKLENKPVEVDVNTRQITAAEYNAHINSSAIVLIDFGAAWCAPCKKMEPVISELQNELKDKFELVHLDGGINIKIMQQLKVAAIPTFILYKNGKEVWRKQGIVEKQEFVKQIGM
jgi:thioredoxin